MRIAKEAIPVQLRADGTTVRQLGDFGAADGTLAAEHLRIAAGLDIAPLLVGLTDNRCQSPHWGYLVSGRVAVAYADGTVETIMGGDLFHWPGGHTVRVDEDAELVMFSPHDEHRLVLEHMNRALSGGQ